MYNIERAPPRKLEIPPVDGQHVPQAQSAYASPTGYDIVRPNSFLCTSHAGTPCPDFSMFKPTTSLRGYLQESHTPNHLSTIFQSPIGPVYVECGVIIREMKAL